MADPVMSDFPLRKVLTCIERGYKTRDEIVKKHSLTYPMEAWIRFSDRLRRAAFKEEQQEEIDAFLSRLENGGYIQEWIGREHPDTPTVKFPRPVRMYRLTSLGIKALESVRKR